MDVFQKLRGAEGLTGNDRAITTYVLDHPEQIASLSSRELGALTFTSSSSVVRTCRKLGFEGFEDLKINVASDLKRTRPGSTEMTSQENALSAAAKVAELEQTAITETRQAMDLSVLQRAADALEAARGVDVCGIGPNAAIAHHASNMLERSGVLASVRDSADGIAYFSSLVPPDHAALVVSRGGRDGTVTELLGTLRRRSVPSVLLTADMSSPAAELATLSLGCLYGEFETVGEMVFSASALYVVDTLCALLVSKNLEESRRLFEGAYEALSKRMLGNAGWDKDSIERI